MDDSDDFDDFDGQPIFYVCVKCGGENKRSWRSPGSTNCKQNSCTGVRKRGQTGMSKRSP